MEHRPLVPNFRNKIHSCLLITDFLCEDAGLGVFSASEAEETVLWRARPQV
jgi:hypothetical protein